MLADYDPMGLSVIVPILCLAALFGGLWFGLSREFAENTQWLRWAVMIAFPIYACFRVGDYLDEAYLPSGWVMVSHFVFPALLWAWQVWLWRSKISMAAPVSGLFVAPDYAYEAGEVARRKLAEYEAQWKSEGLSGDQKAENLRAMIEGAEAGFEESGLTPLETDAMLTVLRQRLHELELLKYYKNRV